MHKALLLGIVEEALDIKIKNKRIVHDLIGDWHVEASKVIRPTVTGFKVLIRHKSSTREHSVTAIDTVVEVFTFHKWVSPTHIKKFDLHDPNSVKAIVEDLRWRIRGIL